MLASGQLGDRKGFCYWQPSTWRYRPRWQGPCLHTSKLWPFFLALVLCHLLGEASLICPFEDEFNVCATGMESVGKSIQGNFQSVLTPTPHGPGPIGLSWDRVSGHSCAFIRLLWAQLLRWAWSLHGRGQRLIWCVHPWASTTFWSISEGSFGLLFQVIH